MAEQETWMLIAKRKQEQRQSKIPKSWLLTAPISSTRHNVLDVPQTCGILNRSELEITERTDATDLLGNLISGSVKSVDVVTAFCKRAAIAHQLTNCLTEIFFDDAIRRAKELDDYFAKTGMPKGPLHGLPISLKDSFRVKGYDASIGIAALCFKEAMSNSTLVDILLEAGAVIYCKTNVPQTLMALDSHNNVFGRTLNPANLRLTAGGSSGGEATLVALRGSILGIGTDVGGSIRIPAMCHGLYGIKPSHGRIPYANQESGSLPGSGAIGIQSSAGPIAHSVRDCELLFKVMSDMNAWDADPEVVPQPWTNQTSIPSLMSTGPHRRPLRIGIVHTDGITTPLPPIANFMNEIASNLANHPSIQVIDLDLTSLLSRCQSLTNALFSIDGANTMLDLLARKDEPLSPWLQTRLKRRPPHPLDRVRALQAQRNDMQTSFLQIWKHHNLNAILCPVAPHPTPEIDSWNTAAYTSSFVLLDYPAATLPVRKLNSRDLEGEIDTSIAPLSSWDTANKQLWTEVRDRNVYLDSWLCVQVVGQKLQEKKVLKVMGLLDGVFKGYGSGSRSGSGSVGKAKL